MNSLIVIPARGGSKGIPRKNIKSLGGKPLIWYSLNVARQLVDDSHICLTTDDDEIIEVAERYGLAVPFKRPAYLATDKVGTYEVLLHAVEFYENGGESFDSVVLLQPTSPFRLVEHVKHAMSLFTSDIDMVVSVKKASSNPYYDCFEEDEQGFLKISKGDGSITRRQDAPAVYEYNGSVYVINVKSLKKSNMASFKKVVKYEMPDEYSIDIDTPLDWQIAELMLKNKLVNL